MQLIIDLLIEKQCDNNIYTLYDFKEYREYREDLIYYCWMYYLVKWRVQ